MGENLQGLSFPSAKWLRTEFANFFKQFIYLTALGLELWRGNFSWEHVGSSSNPGPWHWQLGVLATELPGKSPSLPIDKWGWGLEEKH